MTVTSRPAALSPEVTASHGMAAPEWSQVDVRGNWRYD
jgi:hypothetical protein